MHVLRRVRSRSFVIVGLIYGVTAGLFVPSVAEAHRDGCHRWHSCPSDTGSYVCGDLGYDSECPDKNPAAPTPSTPPPPPPPPPPSSPRPAPSSPRPAPSVPPAPVTNDAPQCFGETGQCIEGRARQYWERHGGLAVFGFPITGVSAETNHDTGQTYQTQWLERNRFELHPENQAPYEVLLGRLGDDRLRQLGKDWQSFPKAGPTVPHYFAATGHAIAHEPFWRYWSTHGLEFDGRPGTSERESLALFGYPISEPAMETNASGDTVLTQWFERARLEDHGAKGVLLGLLGKEVKAGPPQQAPVTPAPLPAPSPPPAPAPVTPPAPAVDECSGIPAPVSATIRPSACVKQGDQIFIDIFGFAPNENIGFWLTDPDGDVVGTVETVNIGPTGRVVNLPLDTNELYPGLWYFVFEGTASKHQSIVYFKVR